MKKKTWYLKQYRSCASGKLKNPIIALPITFSLKSKPLKCTLASIRLTPGSRNFDNVFWDLWVKSLLIVIYSSTPSKTPLHGYMRHFCTGDERELGAADKAKSLIVRMPLAFSSAGYYVLEHRFLSSFTDKNK